MANDREVYYTRLFFTLVSYASRRQLIDFLAITNGEQLGKPSGSRRKRAAQARELLIKQQMLLQRSVKCRVPDPDWNGLVWRSQWGADIHDLAVALVDPLTKQWDRHTGDRSSSTLHFSPQQECDLVASVRNDRSEFATSRLLLTSVLLCKLAAGEIDLSNWSLDKPLTFTNYEFEVSSPAATCFIGGEPTLVCVPVPPFWDSTGESVSAEVNAVAEYTERMLKRLDSDGRPYELWIPRHPKEAWPDLKPLTEKDD